MSESGADRETDERPDAWRRVCDALPTWSIRLPAPNEAPAVLRLQWRIVVSSCWAIFWLFAINLADPLGIFSNADRYSGDLFHRAMAALSFETEPAADIAVILWTDLDLIEMERPWPVPYGDHAEALRLIREMEPEAVFVDIAFVDDRLATDFTAPELIHEIRAYEGKGDHPGIGPAELPDLFIADPAPFSEETSGYEWALNSEFRAIPVAVPGAAFERFGQQYPYMGPSNDAMSILRSNSRSIKETEETRKRNQVRRETAACALFATLHTDRVAESDSRSLAWCKDRSDRLAETGSEPLMGVQWITRPSPILRSRNLTRECKADMPDGVLSAAWSLLQPRQTCGPFPTYTLVDLLVASPSQRGDALHGKVVFYGADILAVSDRVEPPTHEPIPGVFLHAMAYENLVRHDGQPLRTSLSLNLDLLQIGIDDLLFLIGLTLIVPIWKISVAIEGAYKTASAGQTSRVVWRCYRRVLCLELGFIFAALLIVTGLILVGYPLLNLTPVNFVGLVGLVLVWELFNLGVFIPPNGFGLGRWHVKGGWLARKLCAPDAKRPA